MAPSLDRALWHLFREHHLSVYTLVVYCGIAGALAVSCFIVVEKRTRSSWRRVPAESGVGGDGPYRQGVIAAFLEKAPAPVRMTSFAGIALGATGLVWPALLVMDLLHGSTRGGAMLPIEVVATAVAVLSFFCGVALLRRTPTFASARCTLAFRIMAALLFSSSVACLLGVFDDIEVMAYGVKWREPTTLGDFTRSGFNGFVGGHVGLAWRLVLRAASLFGILSAVFLAFYARATSPHKTTRPRL